MASVWCDDNPRSPDALTGKRLAQLRKRAGLTQQELAVAAGLYFTTISRIERGEHQPHMDTLQALATALNVSTADLLADPEPEEATT